ncbi:hypothetical protein NDU88_003717 [Pleurodeles waltl]|uniref:Uncharacterized protein n=1 Tax=Pleurodeles waltl TaxID=8319 RepID=A0AAV7T5R7_PLEWA|nr:hypothetical protein NDU88_003717 [Pleurodeles waltl]
MAAARAGWRIPLLFRITFVCDIIGVLFCGVRSHGVTFGCHGDPIYTEVWALLEHVMLLPCLYTCLPAVMAEQVDKYLHAQIPVQDNTEEILHVSRGDLHSLVKEAINAALLEKDLPAKRQRLDDEALDQEDCRGRYIQSDQVKEVYVDNYGDDAHDLANNINKIAYLKVIQTLVGNQGACQFERDLGFHCCDGGPYSLILGPFLASHCTEDMTV